MNWGSVSAYLADDPDQEGAFGRFSLEVLRQVDAEVDFSRFDSDGPDEIPNSGDDDGQVDAVFIVVSSTPARFVLGAATGIADLGFGEGRSIGGVDVQGNSFVTNDRSVTGEPMRISAYQGTIQRGRTYAEAVGSMCHEYGHLLGLPDLYDIEYLQKNDAPPEEDSAGIGAWGLMGWGALGWNGDDGPNSFCAWSRMQLGWADLRELDNPDQVLQLEDVGQTGQITRVPLSRREFFLIEYRSRSSTHYDRHIPGEGVLTWHVERTLLSKEQPSRTRVDLECADGKWTDAGYPLGTQIDPRMGGDNLDFWAHDPEYARRHAGNLGDSTDVFGKRGFRAFTPETNPDSHSSDSTRSVRIENIRTQDGNAFAEVHVQPPRIEIETVRPVDDSDDGVWVAGEEGYVYFDLINQGGMSAREMRAVLSSDDPLIEIVQGETPFEDMEIGEKFLGGTGGTAAFPRLRFVPGFSGTHTAGLRIDIYAGQVPVGEREFSLTAATSRQVVRETAVTDSLGNRDGRVQTGEFFHLALTLATAQTDLLRGLRFSLRPLDARVQQAGSLGVLFEPDEEGRARSALSPEFLLLEGVEPGTELGFELAVESGWETWKDTLYLHVETGTDQTPPRISLVRTQIHDEGITISPSRRENPMSCTPPRPPRSGAVTTKDRPGSGPE